jgi:hypothetical protein
MRNFHRDHQRFRALLTPGAALSLGLWLLALGCSIYDDALLDDGGPVAGSGGSGESGTANDGGMADSPQAGKASGGGGSQGSGAEPGAGSGGATAGSGATAAGGSTGGDPSAGSSSGGTGGTGGTPVSTDADWVDDMEDGDAQIVIASGRNGYWYVGNDGTAGGTQEPPVTAFAMSKLTPGERPNSSWSAHTKASGFKSWGSVLGFNFSEQLGMVQAYDASAYCGVRYWAKAAAATSLRFRVPDGNTHPVGAVCVDGGPAGMACYDHFSAAAAFTTQWQEFTVMFAALQQIGSGYHPPSMKLQADKLYGLEWALPGQNASFEIWVDDVELLKCE